MKYSFNHIKQFFLNCKRIQLQKLEAEKIKNNEIKPTLTKV